MLAHSAPEVAIPMGPNPDDARLLPSVTPILSAFIEEVAAIPWKLIQPEGETDWSASSSRVFATTYIVHPYFPIAMRYPRGERINALYHHPIGSLSKVAYTGGGIGLDCGRTRPRDTRPKSYQNSAVASRIPRWSPCLGPRQNRGEFGQETSPYRMKKRSDSSNTERFKLVREALELYLSTRESDELIGKLEKLQERNSIRTTTAEEVRLINEDRRR
jgi:hypothetical protein